MPLGAAIILAFVTQFSLGQDTVMISNTLTEQSVIKFTKYFKDRAVNSPDSAYQHFLLHPELTRNQSDAFIGVVNEPYWFLTELKNTSDLTHFVFEIRHSHLRHIAFYEVINGKVAYKSTVGEMHPFNSRPIAHRHFSFPISLEKNQTVGILLYVDHQNTLGMPTRLWSSATFHQHNYKFNLFAGLIIGFLLFCFFMALVCFVYLRVPVFGWYAVYLFFTITYLVIDLGFAFQFIFPSVVRLDGPLSIYAPILVFAGLCKFVQEFLDVKRNLLSINRILTILILILLVLIGVDLVFQESFRQYSYHVLPIVFGLISIGLLVVLLTGILSLKTSKKSAIYFLASYSFLISSFLFAIFGNAYGWITYTVESPAYIGILLEVSILSIALVGQYRDMYQNRADLQRMVTQQQKEMYLNYIEGIEKERKRIAGDLHDDIGSKLSYLQRTLFKDNENAHSKLLEGIIHDVRNISHDLAPTVPNGGGLLSLVEKLVITIRDETNIDVKLQVYDFKDSLASEQVIQIYRIFQEALQNVVKHAGASKVDVQLFGYDNELQFTIEDNGIGFEVGDKTIGFGLNQMRIRATNLGGHIEINSHKGLGTLILVQVPVKNC